MNPIRSVVCVMMLFATIAYGAVRGALPEFADVKFDRGVLIITTDDSQGQFVSEIGKNGVAAVLPANSEIEVPLGDDSLFYLRHLSLKFTPLSDGKGFIIKRTTDLRSLRRGLKEESFALNIDSTGRLIFGATSVKDEISSREGRGPIKQQANSVEKNTNEVQPLLPAAKNQLGTETVERPKLETKTAVNGVAKEVDSRIKRRRVFTLLLSGLVVILLTSWLFIKANKMLRRG